MALVTNLIHRVIRGLYLRAATGGNAVSLDLPPLVCFVLSPSAARKWLEISEVALSALGRPDVSPFLYVLFPEQGTDVAPPPARVYVVESAVATEFADVAGALGLSHDRFLVVPSGQPVPLVNTLEVQQWLLESFSQPK